ncbi:hypothetical protein KSP40_PGU018408 [Platanthera guangdongensis]|uniref:Uncharacterized protein n=1 Tax=Platanthera guangdongensis TaxID=2320717 RepID=A0ABR2LXE3_9ASPA
MPASAEAGMVFFCFLVDTRKMVRSSKPAAGICSRCGGGASVADMESATRFCYVPIYRRTWRAIICTFCGALLKSYYSRRRGDGRRWEDLGARRLFSSDLHTGVMKAAVN